MRRSSGLALALALAAAPAFAADDGKAVYEIRCAPCHGSEGSGDGPAAAAIEPKPRNFRDPSFWRGRTRTSLRMTVEQGRPGTMMSPFKGVLSEAEIDEVVRYVESFRPAQ
jgi:high-affinity iron transporter